MDPKLEQLGSYNVVNAQQRISLLNARPSAIPFQNTATPTAVGATESAIITIGDYSFVWNQVQLGTISGSGNTLPASLYLQFNVYDSDNLGLFGGINPRASTVFGAPIQIAYALQSAKVFPPRTRLKLEWTNRNLTVPLGFEMFFLGMQPISQDYRAADVDDIRDALDEILYEKRTR